LLYVFHFCKCILILTFEHANIQFFFELKGEKNRNFNKVNIKRKKDECKRTRGNKNRALFPQCTARTDAVHCRERVHNGG
ncbi:MAG: hypothetical protein SPF90_03055, partial [Bacteroidaceae bacterium]|nr:hypothetical protein [Bacteroidaceae bacterium]